MLKIVFVDDEQSLLDALRNLLRKDRVRWSMSFVLGGKAALEQMEQSPPDVVVSDMRMPGMDGAELLARVKERFPATARLVLSGHAEREAVWRALPVAHQFLSKPCEAELLRSTIERTCALQQTLQGPEVRTVVGKVSRLPSLPAIYRELSELTARPDVGMAEIAKVLERDPAMSGKVLQLVNSAFFGSVQKATTVQRAASYLGTELIKSLVLTTEAFGAIGGQNHQLIEEVQLDAMKTAQLARSLLQGRPEAEAAMTAALLHDIGKLVVATGAPHLYAACQQHPDRATRSPVEIEKEIYGATHPEIGAYLLGVWGLPFVIVEAVAHHHRPSNVTAGDRTVLAAVHAASLLVDGRGDEIDLKFLEAAGYANQLPRWKELAAEMAR